MVFDLIVFGGIIFWCMIIITSCIVLSCIEEDECNGASFFTVIVGLILFYIFSKPPIISWQWIASYIGIGFAWFTIKFHYNLIKIKKYCKANPHVLVDNKLNYSKCNNEIYSLYKNEPNLFSFMDRVLAWPFSLIKTIFYSFIDDLYNYLAKFLSDYKDRFLGISK